MTLAIIAFAVFVVVVVVLVAFLISDKRRPG